MTIPTSLLRTGGLLAVLALLLAGCSAASAGQDVSVLSAGEAVELLEQEPDAVVLDVRTPAEVAQGSIQGAMVIDFQGPDFEEQVAELDRDATYVLYCRSGNRSAQAAQLMLDMGFSDLYDAGAYEDLAAVGLPIRR